MKADILFNKLEIDNKLSQFFKSEWFINSGLFSGAQMKEIHLGFLHGLTMEQVLVYAKPEFRGEYDGQMFEIRFGFENKLTMEQVLVYAKPEFDIWKMTEIRATMENKKDKLTSEIVSQLRAISDDNKLKTDDKYEKIIQTLGRIIKVN